MKRSAVLSLISALLVLCLTLCSCSGGNEPTTEAATSPHDSEQSYTVAILQFDNDDASNTMRETYISRMRTLGYDEAKMKFDILSAHGSTESLSANAQSLVNSKYSLIVAVGTVAAKTVSENENTVPCVFIGADDPVANGLCTNLDVPDKNMTGTAFRSSGETLLSVMRVYTADVSTLAIVCFEGNAAAENDAKTLEEILSENAYTVNTVKIGADDDLSAKISELCSQNDALYFPDGSYSQQDIETALDIADENGKLVFASNESFVRQGALLGAFSGSEALAKDAALMSDKLMQGSKISDIPVKTDTEISLFVNKATAENYNVEMPASDNLAVV